MTHTWLYALTAVSLISLISLLGVITLSFSDTFLRRFIFVVVSVSVGALFGDVFLHLLPDIYESGHSPVKIALLVLAGILFFFALEKFLHWRHSHGEYEESIETESAHSHELRPLGHMVLISDGVHNFIDGVVLGAAFLIGRDVGIATAIAIMLHEIPHEIANFGLLIHSGASKRRALFLNFCSALPAVLGTVLTLLIGARIEYAVAFIIPFAAGNFIYIAGSDLVPELHKTKDARQSVIQFLSIVIGISIMLGLVFLE